MSNTLRKKKSILTDSGIQIVFSADRVIELNYPEEIELDLKQAKELDELILDLVNGEKFFLLVNLKNTYGKMSNSAQRFFAKEAPSSDLIIASVIIVNNLPIRILVKFYIRTFKPKYPTKIFSEHTAAKLWFNSFE